MAQTQTIVRLNEIAHGTVISDDHVHFDQIELKTTASGEIYAILTHDDSKGQEASEYARRNNGSVIPSTGSRAKYVRTLLEAGTFAEREEFDKKMKHLALVAVHFMWNELLSSTQKSNAPQSLQDAMSYLDTLVSNDSSLFDWVGGGDVQANIDKMLEIQSKIKKIAKETEETEV